MRHEAPADESRLGALHLLAPTWVEWCALRAAVRGHQVERCGLRLERWRAVPSGGAVVLCGLAGALRPGLPPGSIFVPDAVATPDGQVRACDSRLVEALRRGAQRLGYPPYSGTLLSSRHIVTGAARAHWSNRGYDAADMETGFVPGAGLRMATVRVILDTPDRPLAPEWEHPLDILRHPRVAGELLWLAANGPRFALRAARVVRSAIPDLERSA